MALPDEKLKVTFRARWYAYVYFGSTRLATPVSIYTDVSDTMSAMDGFHYKLAGAYYRKSPKALLTGKYGAEESKRPVILNFYSDSACTQYINKVEGDTDYSVYYTVNSSKWAKNYSATSFWGTDYNANSSTNPWCIAYTVDVGATKTNYLYATTNETAKYNSDVILSALRSATKTGYTLYNWQAHSSNPTLAKTVYSPGEDIVIPFTTNPALYPNPGTENQGVFKFFANWAANKYTVTFNKNGGSGGTDSLQVTYNAKPGNITIPSRTGYTFTGYYDATSGGTQYFNSSGVATRNWDKAADTVLYARWSINSYSVTYNSNGGTGTVESQTANYNSTISLRANSFSKANTTSNGYVVSFNTDGGNTVANITAINTTSYSFNKWARNSTSGTQYSAGASYTIPASNTVMYALWNSTLTRGSITLPIPTKTGYDFKGWLNGSTNVGSGSFTPTSNVTLKALWEPHIYTITLNDGGGSGGQGHIYKRFGDAWYSNSAATNKITSVTKPTRAGYKFLGYYSNSGGVGVRADGTINGSVNLAGDATWTARWDPIECTITAHAMSGTISTTSGWTIQAGNKIALKTAVVENPIGTLPTVSRSYGSFIGWFTEKISGTRITENYKPTSSMDIYAQWNIVRINFDCMGGIKGSEGEKFTRDMVVGSSPGHNAEMWAPTRDGYLFDGWYTAGGIKVYSEAYNAGGHLGTRGVASSDNLNTYWDNNLVWWCPEEITLYAHWIKKSYVYIPEDATHPHTVFSPTNWRMIDKVYAWNGTEWKELSLSCYSSGWRSTDV